MRMSRLFVVSNRIANLHAPMGAARGGLAVAIEQALRKVGGIWLGWSGQTSENPDSHAHVATQDGITLAQLDLTERQVDEYYNGFANQALWPLCHYRTDLTAYDRSFRTSFAEVNRAFAHAIHQMLRPDDIVWVHDYHFIPLGRELRALGVDNRIGFFLHIPWPAREIFTTLPEHEELVWSMFAYDLVGFQSRSALVAFKDYLTVELQAALDGDDIIDAFGRRIMAKSYPISIDPSEFTKLAQSSAALKAMADLQRANPDCDLLVGVDRIDYSKGLPQKFATYARLLERHRDCHRRVHFFQIGQPSRSAVSEYQALTSELVAQAGSINGLYGQLGWNPLSFHTQSYSRDVLAGIYRAAKAALVTPLRDGMNLVAKEFIAAQDEDDPGVLILSRFAGAAEELTFALLVNPFDQEGCVTAIRQALTMSRSERTDRWQALREIIAQNSLFTWVDNFLGDLESLPRKQEGSLARTSLCRGPASLRRVVDDDLFFATDGLSAKSKN